jgi:hypothetical protein
MDEGSSPNAEQLVRELLSRVVRGEGQQFEPDPVGEALPENAPGLLAAIESWGSQHPEAAAGLTRAVISAAPNGIEALPLGPLLTDLMDLAVAFGSLADGSVQEFLRLRAPRIVTAPNGTMKWGLLTAISDRGTLVREVIGPTSTRPHHRLAPPSVDVHLAEAHHAEELREALGLSLRQALEIDERPAADRVSSLFGPLVSSVSASNPELAAGLEWLMRNQPDALLAMPLTVGITDAIQGDTTPREDMHLQFTHLVELPDLGFVAFVMWDPAAPLTARDRNALAGHIRQLADTAVAPWNRWSDIRTRREAFAVWVRHLREEPLEAQALADMLRSRHPDDYADESSSKSVRRIYRISTQFSSVRWPQRLMKTLREEDARARSRGQ